MNIRTSLATLLVLVGAAGGVATAQQAISFTTKSGELERKAVVLPWPKNPPTRVKRVAPVYPSGPEGITGVVTLQVTLDGDGRVAESRPVQFLALGPHAPARADAAIADVFAKSASDAVTAWQYEPVGDGPVTFMMSVVIRPPRSDEQDAAAAREVKLRPDNPALKKVRDVKPRYPAAASHRGIQGVIVLEATIGPDARVVDARVLRAIPYLDQAALDAAVQWEFDPQALAPGVAPRTVITQFTLNFSQQ